MTVYPTTPLPPEWVEFHDLHVDNEGFFDAVERRLEDALSANEVYAQTRREIKLLMAEMKQNKIIQGVTEYTAAEQRAFLGEIKRQVLDTWVLFSGRLQEVLREVVKREAWREINDDGLKYSLQDGAGHTILTDQDCNQFLATSFLVEQETSIIPMDLSLTITEDDTIESARTKLARYDGRYNALVLLNAEHQSIGIVRSDALDAHEHSGNTTLEGVAVIRDAFGYYRTSRTESASLMRTHEINILPIIDSQSGVLLGILTARNIEQKECQYYSTVSLAKLSLDCLKSQQESF